MNKKTLLDDGAGGYGLECLRYIDSWGSGTIKIVDACKAAKLPEPEMDEQFGGFIVKLFNDKYWFSEEQLQKKDVAQGK
ncbi:MAG: ATP-binding protein [Mangrovibacterium sp.]